MRVSEPTLEEVQELYDRAYLDWQDVSVALIGRGHGSRDELLAEIARLKRS